MTNKIEVTQADGEMAASIRAALIKACPGIPSYPTGIVEPFLAAHRTRNDAQVQALVEALRDCVSLLEMVGNEDGFNPIEWVTVTNAQAELAAWEGQQ